MKILIVGAGFVNKGAQSMLFITADEIQKRCPDSEIYFTTPENLDMSNYKFKNVFYTPLTQELALKKVSYPFYALKYFMKDTIKYIVGRRKQLFKSGEFRKIVNQVDLIIDVSGFNLGEKWDILSHKMYLNNIKLAKKNGIPIYLMPQSFGGFAYSDDKKFLLDEMAVWLKYPKIIFAREPQGKEMLESSFKLSNVERSYDLVLQNKGVTLSNLFIKRTEFKLPDLPDGNNVAITPNKQCFNHGSKEAILAMYRSVVAELEGKKKNIYIFRHSDDDKEVCELIYGMFKEHLQVNLIDREFNCLEYDRFIRNFQFIICSRFHGIVHAYRNNIPSVALGWEIKYQELAKAVGQEQFVFSIISSSIDTEGILKAVDDLCDSYSDESLTIQNHLVSIQSDNCFDKISELKGEKAK